MADAPHLSNQVILRRHEERRLLAGHPWIFSNEIAETRGNPIAGDTVEILSGAGKILGTGFYHPHSLIAVRRISAHLADPDASFFRSRLTRCLDLRSRLYPGQTSYRLVHGESDGLPGLVIDRYNEYLSLQTFSCGMERHLPVICDQLEELLHPTGIVERNESPLRDLEEMPRRSGILRGMAEPTVHLELDVRFAVHPLLGQKTGFFLDQRENRLLLRRFSPGMEVLDAFCNDGGFALHAARAGALSVYGLDISAEAVERAQANAVLNGLNNVRFEKMDVFDTLKSLGESGTKFDVVVLDPPSFTRSRKTVPAARRGYRDLNAAAMRILRKGGILFSASCSHHITGETFLDAVVEAGRRSGRELQLLDWRGAAPDHPVLPQVPETAYLKCAVLCVR
jgi:23S rRNA (cytosine1962-C5)-methyltransferase